MELHFNMKVRLILLVLFVATVCGCFMDPPKDQNVKPIRKPTKAWYGDPTTLLETDALGCKVYEIERPHCWVYVNNQGGIAVYPKTNKVDTVPDIPLPEPYIGQ